MPPFKLARPLVFFDLETTGLMQEIDRVIELGLLKLFPDGRRQKLLQRFNPGIKIPAESSAVHGITNKDLEGQPKFFEKAKELFDLFADSDLGGYNIKRFDIPMLTKEFEIAGLNFSMEGRRIVDPSVIFRVREPRSLSAAYKFYVGKELTDAHSAEADNDATFEVFLAQMERYPDLPRDVEGLHALGNAPDPGWVDADGKLVWRDGEA
ncbi:MAG TPA: 3'-5' exonuclease, partial [Elusimicrobiota bacterium]|nr:3'-5' exonuclease [Elusimicrobiota bacterium]